MRWLWCPCPRSHRAVCWLLEGSAVCRWNRTGQITAAPCSGSPVGLFAGLVALCCAYIQTFTHFPHLGWSDSQDRQKILFVFALCHSPLPTHGLDIPVSLTLDPILHSESLDILQKSLFNTWLPHLAWPYIPWRCACFRLMGCELPGACRLWKTVCTAVLCILGSVF